jgi:hypothetical protein
MLLLQTEFVRRTAFYEGAVNPLLCCSTIAMPMADAPKEEENQRVVANISPDFPEERAYRLFLVAKAPS